MKVLRGERELSPNDVEEIPKGAIPGEWVLLHDQSSKKIYSAYINPLAEVFYKIKIIGIYEKGFDTSDEKKFAENIIIQKISESINRRKIYINYKDGCRLVYGINDCLPGLIVDKYKKYILVQVNTAGLDRFREVIRTTIQNEFPHQKVVFYDNIEYRKAEVLPTHEKEMIDGDLEVVENNLNYKISNEIMQKIGYYYDHRENRLRLKQLLISLNIKKEIGLDLFSYVGSWGLHLLSSGVGKVDFVDQGNMGQAIETNLSLNGFAGKGEFIRSDVFKYLDQAANLKKHYDIIVSDPPAFTKSEKNKSSAIQGYEKLHSKALKLFDQSGVFIAGSCTHYVSYEELDKTVQDAAFKNGQKLQLLDMGGQGHDHPMSGLKDKSFYIKYLVYYVTRG
jgi:23S rRNA (cytosine1962-C5)-methyltransferase